MKKKIVDVEPEMGYCPLSIRKVRSLCGALGTRGTGRTAHYAGRTAHYAGRAARRRWALGRRAT